MSTFLDDCYLVGGSVRDEIAHRLLHECSQPPKKPSSHDMVQAIVRHEKRLCSCGS